MTPLRITGGLAALVLLACQPTGERDGGDALEALDNRLDATDERLAAIDAKLDALTTKLDETATALAPVTEWAQASKARGDDREARRKERETRREELRGRDGEAFVPSPTGREIEGAAEAIHCRGQETLLIECEVDRAFIDMLLDNPAMLVKQVRIVPSMRDGKTKGYKLYGIRPGSLPKLLSIKNGDLITHTNGTKLESLDTAMALYTKLRKAPRLELGLERKGTPLRLVIDFVE